MRAIVTTYSGPTNERGSRVRASMHFGGPTFTSVNWDHALDTEANHRRAAEALVAKKINRRGLRIVGAEIKPGKYAWIVGEAQHD